MKLDNISLFMYTNSEYRTKFRRAIYAQIKNHPYWRVIRELSKIGFTHGWSVKMYNDGKVRFLYEFEGYNANHNRRWSPPNGTWKDICFTFTDCGGRLAIDETEDIVHDTIRVFIRRGSGYYFGCKVPKTEAGIEKFIIMISNLKNNIGYHTRERYQSGRCMSGLRSSEDKYFSGTRDLDKEALESPWN